MKFEKVDYGKKLRDYLNSDIDQMYKNMLLNLFPELGESEDESIKNWCISHFMECFRVSKENAEYQEYLNNKVIPWLEKQGEQKPDETEKGAKGNEREIPNSAWSEEDKEMLENIICDINTARQYVYVKSKCDEEIDWLNSIKDRVQPRQEWGEEDKRIIDNLVSQLGNLYARKLIKEETKDKYVNWLKSLRPQSTWKPSDKQMEALDSAIHCYAGISPTNNREVYALEIMKEQLKKLREE